MNENAADSSRFAELLAKLPAAPAETPETADPSLAASGPDRAEPVQANSDERAKANRSDPARRVAADRFSQLNAFVDSTMRDLDRSQLAVWLVLFRDANAKTGVATTSQSDLARRVGQAERTCREAVRRLVELNLIEIVRRGTLASGPSSYRVWATGKPLGRQPESRS